MRHSVFHLILALFVIGCCKSKVTVTHYNIINDSTAYVGEPVQFNTTVVAGSSYLWSFGDGTTSTSTSPTHIYNKDGNFTVKLEIDHLPQYAANSAIRIKKNPAKMVVDACRGRTWRFFEGKGSGGGHVADSFVRQPDVLLQLDYISPFAIRVNSDTTLFYDSLNSSTYLLHFSLAHFIYSSDYIYNLYYNSAKDTAFYRKKSFGHGYFVGDVIYATP